MVDMVVPIPLTIIAALFLLFLPFVLPFVTGVGGVQ